MSSIAVPAPLNRAYRFYQTTVDKKAIMAGTGVILFGFILGHLSGNLLAFEGREKFDALAKRIAAGETDAAVRAEWIAADSGNPSS